MRGLKFWCPDGSRQLLSRTPHGVRGLKFKQHGLYVVYLYLGRTPHGVRGLKSFLPAIVRFVPHSRTPHGVRGLKLRLMLPPFLHAGRTPHGVRGLKYF